MRKIFNLKQSSKTKLGACYGYSFFWAKGNLALPENAEETEKEIPLTEDIVYAQWSQFIPSAKSGWIPGMYLDWNEAGLTKNPCNRSKDQTNRRNFSMSREQIDHL